MELITVWDGAISGANRGQLLVPAHDTRPAPALQNTPKHLQARIAYDGSEPWHGTRHGYRYYDCRCKKCVQAKLEYFTAYHTKKRGKALR